MFIGLFVVSGRFGKVRHAGPGLEEAVRAEASWGPSEAIGSRCEAAEVKAKPRSATAS